MLFIDFSKNLLLLYALNVIIKCTTHTLGIIKGNKLRKTLFNYPDNHANIDQLYSMIKEYCLNMSIKPLPNVYLNSANKRNIMVQKHLLRSLDETIGIHRYRRSYCYILFTVNKNNKTVTIAKTFFDAIIKIVASVIIGLVKIMILN